MTILEQAAELRHSAYLFIAKKQTKVGGFASITNTEHGPQTHHTVFYPALISSILAEISEPEQDPIHHDIITRLKNFWLLQPRLAQPSWHTYWAVQDPNYHTLTYPPDLDDTSLVLLSKHHLHPNSDFSEINADYIITLTGQEQKPGGPYRTWIGCEPVPPWNDYDPVVNAAINYTLSKWNVQLPTLQSYLVSALQTDTWKSPYYTSSYLSLYLIVRSLSADQYPEVTKNISEIVSLNPPQTITDWACAIIISSCFKLPFPAGFEKRLCNLKSSDFAAEPCIREQGNDQSGCDALTAALWALAATKITNAIQHTDHLSMDPEKKIPERIHDAAISAVAKKLHALDQTLFESSLPVFCQLIQTPVAKEITLLSYDLGSSLSDSIPEEMYIKLGAANLFGWLAFEWYDQCYDEKIISPSLPLANICLREATNGYLETAEALSVDPTLVNQTFDNVDKAHAMELANNHDISAHLKSGRKLTHLPTLVPAERSFGHCLGPLLIAKSLKISETQYQQLRRLFTHYLNTRQLCDDLHDWHEDFITKRLTSVTRYLFMTTHLFPHAAANQTQKIFWREGLTQALNNANHELQQALSILRLIDWPVQTPPLLSKTLERLKNSIMQAGAERKTSQALLTYFESYESL